MTGLLIILLVSIIGIFKITSLRAREIATAHTRQYCQSLALQLLDQSVSVSATRLKRGSDGAITISRTFVFEFAATGDERYRGSLEMHGNRPQRISLAPHKLPTDEDQN